MRLAGSSLRPRRLLAGAGCHTRLERCAGGSASRRRRLHAGSGWRLRPCTRRRCARGGRAGSSGRLERWGRGWGRLHAPPVRPREDRRRGSSRPRRCAGQRRRRHRPASPYLCPSRQHRRLGRCRGDGRGTRGRRRSRWRSRRRGSGRHGASMSGCPAGAAVMAGGGGIAIAGGGAATAGAWATAGGASVRGLLPERNSRPLLHAALGPAHILEQLAHVAVRHQLAVVQTLRELAADRAQEDDVVLGLDPLRRHLAAQLLGERHDGAQHGAAAGVLAARLHVGAVDLDGVEGELADVGQRRVAGAELVHARGRRPPRPAAPAARAPSPDSPSAATRRSPAAASPWA